LPSFSGIKIPSPLEILEWQEAKTERREKP